MCVHVGVVHLMWWNKYDVGRICEMQQRETQQTITLTHTPTHTCTHSTNQPATMSSTATSTPPPKPVAPPSSALRAAPATLEGAPLPLSELRTQGRKELTELLQNARGRKALVLDTALRGLLAYIVPEVFCVYVCMCMCVCVYVCIQLDGQDHDWPRPSP